MTASSSRGLFNRLFHRRERSSPQALYNTCAPCVSYDSRPVNSDHNHSRRDQPSQEVGVGPCSTTRRHPYGSRSLSKQVAAIQALFPDQNLNDTLQRGVLSAAPANASTPGHESVLRRCEHADIVKLLNSGDPETDHDPLLELNRSRPGMLNGKNSPPESAPHRHANGAHLSKSAGTERLSSLSTERASRQKSHRLSPIDRLPAPLQIKKRTSTNVWPNTICSPILAYEDRRGSLSRKPDIFDLRRASDIAHSRKLSMPVTDTKLEFKCTAKLFSKRRNLNKPLPPLPGEGVDQKRLHTLLDDRLHPLSGGLPQELRRAQTVPDLLGQEGEVKTTVHKCWAPAVTHEKITGQVHEIRQEEITREIRQDHFYHRVQPIVDLELLPARHFVAVGDDYIEVEEDDVPPELRPTTEWLRASTFSKLFHDIAEEDQPGECSTWINEREDSRRERCTRTESPCVHVPTYESAIQETTQYGKIYLKGES